MKLKCQCCGFEQEFASAEDAYRDGWDAPPLFSYVCCHLCPGVCVVLGAGHEIAHALWDKEGRPPGFTLEKCATDDTIGDPVSLKKTQDGMDDIADALSDADVVAVKAELARLVKRYTHRT